jgi:hypothetical protein
MASAFGSALAANRRLPADERESPLKPGNGRLPGIPDRKHLDCRHITIRKSPSGLLSGSNVRTARSKVASFPFLWIASPNK